jgi:hypothetical protein
MPKQSLSNEGTNRLGGKATSTSRGIRRGSTYATLLRLLFIPLLILKRRTTLPRAMRSRTVE